MKKILTMGVLVFASLLLGGQASAWSKKDYKNICYTKLTFDNQLATAVKVQKLAGSGNTNSGEDISNLRIDSGSRKTTSKKRRLFGNKVDGSGAMQNGASRSSFYVILKVWSPNNNRWLKKKAGPYTRTCRDKGNMFFPIIQGRILNR